eukprot:TRINITY_DN11940_c0_g1_i5.p1 TRINITY_DN11940_c0_g1~~TRINITY_DN11940_c0_g1_i5.p1  ORF type:complete len:179 (-),score=27.80 TRINITY_DN11940_c0_g1_i5:21-557(-)
MKREYEAKLWGEGEKMDRLQSEFMDALAELRQQLADKQRQIDHERDMNQQLLQALEELGRSSKASSERDAQRIADLETELRHYKQFFEQYSSPSYGPGYSSHTPTSLSPPTSPTPSTFLVRERSASTNSPLTSRVLQPISGGMRPRLLSTAAAGMDSPYSAPISPYPSASSNLFASQC